MRLAMATADYGSDEGRSRNVTTRTMRENENGWVIKYKIALTIYGDPCTFLLRSVASHWFDVVGH